MIIIISLVTCGLCFVQLQLNNYEHGLTLETGIYISKISPGSLAAKEGNLAVGDRVLSVSAPETHNTR
jgi:S1-C subfamily serine protease